LLRSSSAWTPCSSWRGKSSSSHRQRIVIYIMPFVSKPHTMIDWVLGRFTWYKATKL
jgi:hypothetical protein